MTRAHLTLFCILAILLPSGASSAELEWSGLLPPAHYPQGVSR